MFFAEHPEYVELIMQERALFKDRKRPTFFEYRDRQADLWRNLYSQLIAAGRVRPMPVDRIRDVMGQVLYGTVFTNYFAGQDKTPERQAGEIIDVVFHGILSETAAPPQAPLRRNRLIAARHGDRRTARPARPGICCDPGRP